MSASATNEPSAVNTVRVPAPVNAHSHAFHRVLRGRTHARPGGAVGDFWVWREQMYDAARSLTPAAYERLATAVFAEMVVTGFSAVGEFHYLHHDAENSRYPDHDMERALARAAVAARIRLCLLDTCYLSGGLSPEGERIPLNQARRRFDDGSAEAWRHRWESLVTALAEEDAGRGLLTPQLSAVHATHLDEQDIRRLGEAGVSIVMCPTTEADLTDGIGPARELAEAGATLSLGTDQHAVVDPYLEMRALEHGERLRTGTRGRFSPTEIAAAAREGGLRSLGLAENDDHLRVDVSSVRTAGSLPDQLPLTATAADVRSVVINGEEVARDGIHTWLGDPAEALRAALVELDATG